MKFLIFFSLLLCFTLSNAQTQTFSPGRFSDGGGDGIFDITNTSTSNDTYNCVNLDKNENVKGVFDLFGFSIPDGATVTDITVRIEGVWNTATAPKNHKVSLFNSVTKSTKLTNAQFALTHVESMITSTASGPSIWGLDVSTDLTPDLINSDNFGINIEQITSSEDGGQLCLDFLEISISYVVPLPVTLIEFDADSKDSYTLINWITASEINSDYFVVERSFDGTTFESIDFVDAAGQSSILTYYLSYDFRSNLGGILYYRLKQVDIDGTTVYSNIIAVTKPMNSVSVYYDGTNIKIVPDDSLTEIWVYRLDGTQVDIQKRLDVGIYLITVNILGIYSNFKLIVK